MLRTLMSTAALGGALAISACAVTAPPTEAAANSEYVQTADNASKEEVKALNDIASMLIDATALYEDAAELPDSDPQISTALTELAAERDAQREDLQMRIKAMGVEAYTMGSPVGPHVRLFGDIRTAFEDDSEVAVEEVLRSERYLATNIGEALEEGSLNQSSIQMLTELRDTIQVEIAKLEELDRQI